MAQQDLKLQLYHGVLLRLLWGEASPAAQRLILWLLRGLWISEPPDTVVISRRFLPTDIGFTPAETSEAYRFLYEQGVIERVETAETESSDRLQLRLVMPGLNDSRHPAPYREETFGYPGARIAGEVTGGQTFYIHLSDGISARLGWWFRQEQELPDLRNALQDNIGENIIYIERIQVELRQGKPVLRAEFRYPLNIGHTVFEKLLDEAAEEWIKEHLIHLGEQPSSVPIDSPEDCASSKRPD